MSPAAAVLTGAVRTYQWTIRPVIGAQCRFEPSCSHYALEALAVHGALRGSALTARRCRKRCQASTWCCAFQASAARRSFAATRFQDPSRRIAIGSA